MSEFRQTIYSFTLERRKRNLLDFLVSHNRTTFPVYLSLASSTLKNPSEFGTIPRLEAPTKDAEGDVTGMTKFTIELTEARLEFSSTTRGF